MTQDTEGVVALIENLRQLRVILKSGDYDGADLMHAWCAMIDAADRLQSLSDRIDVLEGRREPKPWIDSDGTLRAPEGFHFTFVDAPGFDTLGYPLKAAKLTRNG